MLNKLSCQIILAISLLVSASASLGSVSYEIRPSVDNSTGSIKLTIYSFSINEFPPPFNPLLITINTNSSAVKFIGLDPFFSSISSVSVSEEPSSTHIQILAKTTYSFVGKIGEINFAASGSGTFSPTVPLFLVNNIPVTSSGPDPIAYSVKNVRQLTVSTNNGGGYVTSTPSAINCGVTCTANLDYGSSITLTAMAIKGYLFTGWTGACSGASFCQLAMDEAKTVTANFIPVERPTPPLQVAATAGNQKVLATWKASQGIVTSYTATSINAAGDVASQKSCTAQAPSTSCEISGLTNGVLYRFTVVATGPGGASDPSAPSDWSIPATSSLVGQCGTASGILTNTSPNPLDLCLAGYPNTPVSYTHLTLPTKRIV